MFQNNLLMAADAATSGTSLVSVENSALYVSGNDEKLTRNGSRTGTKIGTNEPLHVHNFQRNRKQSEEQWFQNEQKSLKNRYKAAKESNDIKLQSKIKREFLNLQDGKDRARSFGNNAPSFIPRSSLLSLYNMDLNEFTQSEDMQEQMSSGRFK